jgi:hypothetical protein
MILSATLGAAVWSDRRNPEILRKPLDSISTEIDGWRSLGNQTLQDRIAASLDATSYLSRIYRKGPD